MRVLVIGNGKSVFVRDFVEQMADKMPLSTIDVLTTDDTLIKARVNIIKPKNRCRIPKLRRFIYLLQYRKLLKGKHYDVAHIHFVDILKVLAIKAIRKSCDKLIVTVWGSDFYRSSVKLARLQERVYDRADYITFATNETLEKFNDYYQDKYVEKLRICTFGLAPLEYLKKMKLTKEDCRRHFSIPEDAITVCVGYNAGSWHRHKEVIRSIARNKSGLPDNMFLIFPMTYGRDEKYVAEVKEEIRKLGIKNLVLDNFMTPEESAMLRMATDVFINVQTTDVLSGSMLEHIYAGSVVVTGDWLPYGALDEMGIDVYKVSKPDDVGGVLWFMMSNLESWKSNHASKENVYEFASWENNIKSWVRLWRLWK